MFGFYNRRSVQLGQHMFATVRLLYCSSPTTCISDSVSMQGSGVWVVVE